MWLNTGLCVRAHVRVCARTRVQEGGTSVIWCLEPWVLTILPVQRTGPHKDLSCPEDTLPSVEKLVKEKTELKHSDFFYFAVLLRVLVGGSDRESSTNLSSATSLGVLLALEPRNQ